MVMSVPPKKSYETMYRMFINGKYHKTYDKIGKLKNAIRSQTATYRRVTPEEVSVEVLQVEVTQIVSAFDIMLEYCPECGQFKTVDADLRNENYWHAWRCPRRKDQDV